MQTKTLQTNTPTCISHSTIGLKNSTLAGEPFQLAASCPVSGATFPVSGASYPSEASCQAFPEAFLAACPEAFQQEAFPSGASYPV